jgi:ketosteroid isomerase-like protein
VSRENVEIVRDSWRAFADGGSDAMTEFWVPEIDWRAIEGAPDIVGEMRGREAVRRYLQDWVDTFEGLTVVAEELQSSDRNVARTSSESSCGCSPGGPGTARDQGLVVDRGAGVPPVGLVVVTVSV